MRRRRCRRPLVRRGAWLVAALVSAAAARGGEAQQPSGEGALSLLLPVGARAVGMAQAATAEQGGSESVWWNPAGLARQAKREIALHHSKTIVATGDAVSLVVPVSVFGVVALSANILNYGEEDVTDSLGTQGTLLPRDLTFAATYAAPVGDHAGVGLTYKIIQARFDCVGACAGVPSQTAASSALDAGVQYRFGPRLPLALGIALRDVGPRLQVNDQPQADPLPTRLHLGLLYERALPVRSGPAVDVAIATDMISRPDLSERSFRLGGDVSLQKKVHLRAGYNFDDGDGAGPAVGFGVTSGNLVIDFARVFRGLSAELGVAPTYLSLRYLF